MDPNLIDSLLGANLMDGSRNMDLVDVPHDLHLVSPRGIRITVNALGATWTSCQVPVADGRLREVLLGSRDLGRMMAGNAYLGATVGRYAGRIANARFEGHQLDANQPPHCLHGGHGGFSRRFWQVSAKLTNAGQVTMCLTSPDGDQGFPGTFDALACYRFEGDDLLITYGAFTDEAGPCNLTNHAYFNLNGGDGDNGLEQLLRIHARHYQPVGPDGIPDGPPRPVEGTGFDFRAPKRIGADLLRDAQQRQVGGYDHSFLLDKTGARKPELAAELQSADGQVGLRIHTSQPALHLYSGNFLAGVEKRDGSRYASHAGIALESQYAPASPVPEEAMLSPGGIYLHVIRITFFTPTCEQPG